MEEQRIYSSPTLGPLNGPEHSWLDVADVSFHEASWLPGHMGKVSQGEDSRH